MITGKKPFLKIFYHFLLFADQSCQVHEQRKFCKVRCLQSHFDNWQADPAAAFIHTQSKKQSVDQQWN